MREEKRDESLFLRLSRREKKRFESLAREKGVSISDLVRLAVFNMQNQEKISEAEQQLPNLLERFLDTLSSLSERLEQLEKRTTKLENWNRYTAYQSTLAVQLVKTRLNNFLRLDEKQFEQYKQHFWPQIHKDVQRIIQEMTGQEVVPWKKD